MNKILSLLTGLILAFSLNPVSAAAGQLKPYKGNLTSPQFNLSDMQGQQHTLDQYRGDIVLVQFWATYCTPCRKEMPTMNRLIEKMQGKPFKIITINMAEPRSAVQAFLDEVPVEFPVLLDNDGTTLGQWKVFAAPANFIVDKKGKIIFTLYGAIEWDSDEMVEKLSAMTHR
jgi:peroxiredoxin